MDQESNKEVFSRNSQGWDVLEHLISPDSDLREGALEVLTSLDGFQDHSLAIYLLATRLLDPDLEIRFHAVQILGELLDFDNPEVGLPDKSLQAFSVFTSQLEKDQTVKLLEVSVEYLAAEDNIARILKLSSYAGKALGGIVNDRKLPVEIRQQALYYCGEVGFLSTAPSIRNLVRRIEKDRIKSGLAAARKKHLDEEKLFSYAVAALSKLDVS